MENKKRLASLDVLRGLDMFLLLAVGPVVQTFVWTAGSCAPDFLRRQVEHVPWEGFALWDIIMPLFMFMSGAAIPFSMSRYKRGEKPGKEFYLKLFRRFALLFFIGWIVQGNLLSFDFRTFHPFANTLQAIAVGYVASALIFVHSGKKGQIVWTLMLFLAYIAAFAATGMNLDPQSNVAMLVDKAVLGAHRDGVIFAPDGTWTYDCGYQYTWILSSLNFAVTVMLGCFAGQIMKGGDGMAVPRKALLLLLTGSGLIAAGLLMSPFFPIIKKIWSSSMTLFSGGICFVLMAGVYYAVDVRGWTRGLEWTKYYGMNSITAYFIGETVVFTSVSASLLHGTEQWLGIYYPVLLSAANAVILFMLLRTMYRAGIFLKI